MKLKGLKPPRVGPGLRVVPAGVSSIGVHLRAHQVFEQERHQREGKHKARGKRHDHRQRKRREEILGRSRQQEHRHEHQADRQGREHGRNGDLARAAQDRVLQGLAQADMALDVLDDDRPVVHEDADRQRETAKRHGVERLPEHVEREHGRDDRKRDRRQNNDCQPPIAQEQEDHQRRKSRGHQPAHDHAVERRMHEDGLVEDGLERHAKRQILGDLGNDTLDAVDHRERGYAARLADQHQRAGQPVLRHRVRLDLIAVVNMRDVPHEHRLAANGLHREVVDDRYQVRTVVHRDGVVLATHLHVAGGQDHVLGGESLADVRWRQAARLQSRLAQADHDHARLAAVGVRHRGAAHDRQSRPDDVLAKVVQLRVGQRVAGKA